MGLRSQILKRQSNLMVNLRMCSIKNEHIQVPLLDRSAPFIDNIVVSKDGVTKLLKGLS